MKSGAGAPNGTSRQSPFDRWFRYPAGFSAASLDRCFATFSDDPSSLIIDPFAGVGTTGTRAIAEGNPFRGIETHPLVAEIAALKFNSLDQHATRDLQHVADELVSSLVAEGVSQAGETSLVRRSFGDQTLRELIALREAIRTADPRFAPYLRCALVATLRDVAAVKVGWPHQRPALRRQPPHRSAPKRFRERVGWLVQDLASLPTGADARIIVGDSRREASWQRALGHAKAHVCLASPPYLNNFDYADATRLELYFLGSVRSWRELCSEVRANMIAASTQQSTKRRAEAGWETLRALPETAKAVGKLTAKLKRERKRRPRGKEYDQVLPAYLADISEVLACGHVHLDDKGVLAWVVGDSAPYGVYIDTPALIAGLAEEVGFTPSEDIALRSRGKRWAMNGTRHQMALSERLIVLHRAS